MIIFLAVLLLLLGGILNGSFAFPIKSMTKWNEENIWLVYSFGNYIIVPWIVLFTLAPHLMSAIYSTPEHIILVMLGGGLLFGVGMICFAYALRLLGLGLAYVISIGIGTAGGALLPLLIMYPDKIATPFGVIELISIGLFLCGVIIASRAGTLRDKANKKVAETDTVIPKGKIALGLVLIIIAGCSSAGQGFTYAYCIPIMQRIALSMGINSIVAANIPWIGIFSAAFVPYTIYFAYKCWVNKSFSKFVAPGTGKYWFYEIIMSVFAFACLICFSVASQMLGHLGPIIAWPMFMTFIVLTSNFWGWAQKEWKNCGSKIARYMWIGIGFLLLAIFTFSYNASNLNLPAHHSSFQMHNKPHHEVMR